MGPMDIGKYSSLGFVKPDEREGRRPGPSPGLTSGSAPDKGLTSGPVSGSALVPVSGPALVSISGPALVPVSGPKPSINLAKPNFASFLSGNQASSLSGNQVNTERPQPKKAELEQICAEFAAIFFQTLLKSMYSTIPKSSLCPEFQGKNLVNSVIDQGVAQFMASQDAAGLKESLLRNLVSDKK